MYIFAYKNINYVASVVKRTRRSSRSSTSCAQNYREL